MTMKHRMNSKYDRERRRSLRLTTALVWAVSSLSKDFPQMAHAFTASPSVASSIYQCQSRVGKRILSLHLHDTSSSSSSSPLPPSIFDSDQIHIQLLPLGDSASLRNSDLLNHDHDLMDALNGLNMPLQQDMVQDNKEFKFSDDNREFELKLGKAMDTLRKDYPEMLTESPDFSIYHEDIEVVDPSGFKLHNLERYKASFRFLHGMLNFFYDPSLSLLTFRLIYDCARKDIRVSWNAYLVPRPLYGGEGNALHLDGISVYVLNKVSGLITHHRVERLLLNDVPVQAPQGIFEAMRNAVGAEEGKEGVPVWNMDLMERKRMSTTGQFNLEFRRHTGLLAGVPSKSSLFSEEENGGISEDSGPSTPTTTSLFSSESSADGMEKSSSTLSGDDNHHLQSPFFNQVAFDRKNASRKKFGLKPITPDEFIQIEAEVEKIASVQRKKASAAHASAEMAKPKPKTNLFGNLFGGILQDTCESNWDCERPEVCCDLGFKKMCCSSGMKVSNGVPQMQLIPAMVPIDDGLPRGGPDTDIY